MERKTSDQNDTNVVSNVRAGGSDSASEIGDSAQGLFMQQGQSRARALEQRKHGTVVEDLGRQRRLSRRRLSLQTERGSRRVLSGRRQEEPRKGMPRSNPDRPPSSPLPSSLSAPVSPHPLFAHGASLLSTQQQLPHGWDRNTELQVKQWKEAAEVYAAMNDVVSLMYTRKHKAALVIVTVLTVITGSQAVLVITSSLTGSSSNGTADTVSSNGSSTSPSASTFTATSLPSSTSVAVNLFYSVCAVLLAIVASLASNLGWAAKAQAHARRSAGYMRLAMMLSTQLSLPPEERTRRVDLFRSMPTECERLEELADPLPPSYMKKIDESMTIITMWGTASRAVDVGRSGTINHSADSDSDGGDGDNKPKGQKQHQRQQQRRQRQHHSPPQDASRTSRTFKARLTAAWDALTRKRESSRSRGRSRSRSSSSQRRQTAHRQRQPVARTSSALLDLVEHCVGTLENPDDHSAHQHPQLQQPSQSLQKPRPPQQPREATSKTRRLLPHRSLSPAMAAPLPPPAETPPGTAPSSPSAPSAVQVVVESNVDDGTADGDRRSRWQRQSARAHSRASKSVKERSSVQSTMRDQEHGFASRTATSNDGNGDASATSRVVSQPGAASLSHLPRHTLTILRAKRTFMCSSSSSSPPTTSSTFPETPSTLAAPPHEEHLSV